MSNNNEKIFKISLLLLGIVVIFSYGINSTFAANSSSIYVSPQGNDSWDGQLAVYNGTSGPKATIKNATGTVNDGGTLYIANGVYNENNITLNTNMSIIGESQQNTIINGTSTYAIFNILPGVNVNVYNLTLTQGNASEGGAIYNNGTVIINNCYLTNNFAIGYGTGGAIDNYGIMTINYSTFTNNTSIFLGDGRFSHAEGGAISNGGNLTISYSTFTNNTANTGDGGAISNGGNLTIISGIFNNNTATDSGGAIFNYNIVTFNNSTFTNNTASYCGAICNNGNSSISYSTFTNNTASFGGSGTISNFGNLTITGCSFTNNIANNSYGGAIFNGGNLTIIGSFFTNNTATDGGGAIYNYYNCTLNVNNSTFTGNNLYNGDGGAIESNGTSTINNSSFTNNTSYFGGALWNNGTSTLINSTFLNNNALYDGAAISNLGNLTINNNRFINNIAIQPGGAISNGGNLTINYSTFTNNTANNGGGGAIYSSGGALTISYTNFTNNIGNYGNGGAIYNYNSAMTINDSSFTNNTSNTYSNNTYAGNGGAICNQNLMNIINSTFTNNTASFGGAIYNQGGTIIVPVTINGSTFTSNYASDGNGGAIFNDGTLNVSNNNFINNNATECGGAIDTLYALYGANNTFTGNNAFSGGVIFCGSNYSTVTTITNSTFTNNTSILGSALWNAGSLTVNNTTFTNNTSIYNGGAIYNGGLLTINYSTFTNNTAIFGGAICNNGNLTINYSTFMNNFATNGGAIFTNNSATYGALYNYGYLTVDNSTFMNNFATSGGAIYNDGSTVVNFNRIVGNIASNGSAILNSGGTVNAKYNWWGSNTDPSNNVAGGANVTTWLVLTITANPNTLPNNANSTITADLQHDSNGTIHDPINGQIPDGILVTFYTTLGTINPSTTIDVSTQSIFNSGSVAGLATVSATVDNQTVQTLITILDTISPTASSNLTNGTYSSPQNVSLSMSEPGTIYYTTDGTMPTYNSNRYLSPITIANTTTLQFFAMDLAGNMSPIYSNTYIINLPPVTPLTASSNLTNGTYNSPQSASLSMSEPGTIYYTTDGTMPTYNSNRYLSPITIANTTTLQFFAMDLAGNMSPIYSNTYTINLPPVTPLTAYSNTTSGLYNSTLNIALSMNEPGTIYYTTDGTTPTYNSNRYLSPISITDNTTLEFFAMDLAGDTSPVYTQIYKIDTIPPKATASITTGYYNTTKTVTFKMSEPGNIYYTINGATPTSSSTLYSGPISISKTTVLKYLAVDIAGNKSPVYTQTYTINKVPPKITSTVPANNAQQVSLTATIPIKFTENILAATNYSKIYVKDLTIGKTVLITKTISGSTLTIKTSKRSANNIYEVVIPSAAIKDLASNNFAATYIFKFKTV